MTNVEELSRRVDMSAAIFECVCEYEQRGHWNY